MAPGNAGDAARRAVRQPALPGSAHLMMVDLFLLE